MFQSQNWCSPHFIMSTFSHNKSILLFNITGLLSDFVHYK